MLCGVCMFLASRDKCACSILYDLHSFLSWVLIFLRFGVSVFLFFLSSRRRHTRSLHDWSSDVCSSDLVPHMSIAASLRTFMPAIVASPGNDQSGSANVVTVVVSATTRPRLITKRGAACSPSRSDRKSVV